MKKQNTQSKLIVVLTSVVLLLVALSATLTFAYFTAHNASSNSTMTFGTLGINDIALNLTPEASTGVHAGSVDPALAIMQPGCTVTLAGDIAITGNIEAFVRIGLNVQVSAPYGGGDPVVSNASHYVAVTGQSNINTKTNFAQVVFNKIYDIMRDATSGCANKVATAEWISFYDEEEVSEEMVPVAGSNFIYLSKAVKAADVTDGVLLSLAGKTITFEAADFGNQWQGAVVTINITADAIQAEHLSAYSIAANKVFTSSDVDDLAGINLWNNITTGTVAA